MITSAVANACGPPPQKPWRPTAMILAGWSMVTLLQFIGEPMPRCHALTTGSVAALKYAAVPL